MSVSQQTLRVVLLTGNDDEHRYMANRLAAALPLVAIVVDCGRSVSRSERLWRLWRRYTVSQLIGRVCIALIRRLSGDHHRKTIRTRQILGADGHSFRRPELLHYIHGINTEQSREIVLATKPDLLLVFGTGVVGGGILAAASQMALNAHTGISPYYRGAECAFWPLHNEEPEMLGATVHECTNDLDGGKIFGLGRPSLSSDDCRFSIFAKCVVTATELYIQVVKQIMGQQAEGTIQDLSRGREYRAADHGLRAELRVRRLMRGGLIRRFVGRVDAESAEQSFY